MQKAESLSLQTVLGLEGRGLSLINEIFEYSENRKLVSPIKSYRSTMP